MPIYEYRCEACSHEFETLQKMTDAVLTTCPACGAEALRKKLSAPLFRLKGSGWYETDFKNTEQRKNLHDSSAPSESAESSASTSNQQAATGTESKATKSEPTSSSTASSTTKATTASKD
jgi:putative FmdB family regulatory protein